MERWGNDRLTQDTRLGQIAPHRSRALQLRLVVVRNTDRYGDLHCDDKSDDDKDDDDDNIMSPFQGGGHPVKIKLFSNFQSFLSETFFGHKHVWDKRYGPGNGTIRRASKKRFGLYTDFERM